MKRMQKMADVETTLPIHSKLTAEIRQPLRRPKEVRALAHESSDKIGDLDSGWAWVVLASAFGISALLWGQVISFNVYFVALRDEFGESRSKTAAIGSLNQANVNLVGISAGFFLRMLGPRGSTMTGGLIAAVGYATSFFATSVDFLLISYALIVGFGYGLCYTACLAAVSKYFKRQLAMATSVSVTGGGVGIIFFSFLLEHLRKTYGWRGSLLLQGGITLHICALGATFFPKKTSTNARKYDDFENNSAIEPLKGGSAGEGCGGEQQPMTARQRLTDTRILLLMTLGFLGGVALLSIVVVYKDLTRSAGFSGSVFELTMSAVGAGQFLGRLVPGFVLRRPDVHPIRYFIGTAVACSVVFFLLTFTTDAIMFVCLSGLIGCGQGNFVSATPIIVAYIFGRQEMAVTYGYILFTTGAGLLFGGPFAGFVADYMGSYGSYLLTCGGLLSLATFLVVLLYVTHDRQTRMEQIGTNI